MEQKPWIDAPQESDIDLLALVRKLARARKEILRGCLAGAVAGLIIAFSIPKEYSVTVKLAPEIAGSKPAAGSLGDLAALAGFSVNNAVTGDAVSPALYPEIFGSVTFAADLFEMPVSDHRGRWQMPLYDYLTGRLRTPWWQTAVAAPLRLLSRLRGGDSSGDAPPDPFRLTRTETEAVQALQERIRCTVDKKTAVITVTVTMQDPLIAATLTDTVLHNLQRYITDYRTGKARHDLAFTQRLHDEAQAAYYEAQSRYARYLDANQRVVLRSVLTEQERLQNEMLLAYNLYNQMAQQLQLAKAKVQESTPVYAVLQPATVPVRASRPAKLMIVLGCIVLFGAGTAAWILFGRELWRRLKAPSD